MGTNLLLSLKGDHQKSRKPPRRPQDRHGLFAGDPVALPTHGSGVHPIVGRGNMVFLFRGQDVCPLPMFQGSGHAKHGASVPY